MGICAETSWQISRSFLSSSLQVLCASTEREREQERNSVSEFEGERECAGELGRMFQQTRAWTCLIRWWRRRARSCYTRNSWTRDSVGQHRLGFELLKGGRMSLQELLHESQEAPQRIVTRLSQLLHSLTLALLQGTSSSPFTRKSSMECNGEDVCVWVKRMDVLWGLRDIFCLFYMSCAILKCTEKCTVMFKRRYLTHVELLF